VGGQRSPAENFVGHIVKYAVFFGTEPTYNRKIFIPGVQLLEIVGLEVMAEGVRVVHIILEG